MGYKKDSKIKAIKSPTNLFLVAELNGKIGGYIWALQQNMTQDIVYMASDGSLT